MTSGVVAAAADCAIVGSTVRPGAIDDAADVVGSDCDSFAAVPGKLSLLPLRGPDAVQKPALPTGSSYVSQRRVMSE